MSFFDKLTEFVKIDLHLNIQIGIKTVNVICGDPSALPAQIDETGHLTINWDKLSPAEKTKARPLIDQDVKTNDALLIDDKSKELTEDIDLTEHETNERALINFFRGKIPARDLTALRSALYLRKKFREHAPRQEIYQLRREIIDKFSERGRIISNLCSSGYFETWIKPLYETLSRNDPFKLEEFTSYYEHIIQEGGFAVFVSSGMTPDDVKSAIEKERTKELRYGIKTPLVNVHGIGNTNVESINIAIHELKKRHTHMKIKKNESMNIISASLTFE